jgi:hypothetical protein
MRKAPDLDRVRAESRFLLQEHAGVNEFPFHPRIATQSARAKVHSNCKLRLVTNDAYLDAAEVDYV